ncbi:MAG: AraC family transcriptional regulator [Bacteroidaceae bacterium]|nr:AraC family transcriptional regulator [Bacteroidaceae bacterium]
MNYSRIRDLLSTHISEMREKSFISNELGMIHGDPSVFMMVLSQSQPPFSIDDYRLGVLARGEIHASINLVERHLTAGTLVFLGPGSILSPISFSDEIEIFGLALFADFPMPFAAGQMPLAFNGQVRDFQIQAGEDDVMTAQQIIDTVWHTIRQKDYNRQTVTSLVGALMHHYDGLYRRQLESRQASQSREQTIFDRFIYLVNQHATREHQIGFYADKMCLTQRYLGTVIRQASGTTAKEWIDRALVEHVKIELKHTDKPIAQISDEMNFPSASFFSKYFKRETGLTPGDYRDDA